MILDRFTLRLTRSVPAARTRSVPAARTRSVPAARTRSVPAARTRSVPAARTRSVPAVCLDPRTYNDLDEHEKKRFDADIRATNINSQLDSGYTQIAKMIDNLSNPIALLAQQFRATFPQTNNQLRTSSNTRNQATVQDGRVVIHNVQGRQNQNQRNFAWGTGAAGNGNVQNRARNANQGQGKPIKCYNCGAFGHIARNYTQPKRPQNSDYFKEKMLLMQAQENGAVLDEEELLFLADDCDAFDLDIDDEPTGQTIFMANLSSAVSSLQQVGPFNALILMEVLNLENVINHHEIPNKVQQTNFLDSDSTDMSNSHVIAYEQYVKHNEESVELKKTLVTEVKEMKEIFKSMEAEVDQNAIDLRSGEIERKNLLITNDNLISKCIAQDVFYTVTNSALTASQFHELSIAYNVA
nr:hypothetical protein [Tanacetum cinerariifolium]